MSKLVVMPKLGLTMVEGKVTKWHKKKGDEVKSGEVILEVETDKLTNEVTADQDGDIRKRYVQEGETVPVAERVAIIASPDEDIDDLNIRVNKETKSISSTLEKEGSREETNKSAVVAVKSGDYVRATPYAKKMA